MKKYIPWIFAAHVLLLLCASFAAAGEILVNLEYVYKDNSYIIGRLHEMELILTERKQKILDDLKNADDSSRRTLATILDIFEEDEVNQYRKTLWSNRVFTSEFIVPENDETYQNVSLPGGELEVTFSVKSRRGKSIPLGMNLHYNDIQIYSGAVTVYPTDRLIMVHESYMQVDDDKEELEILFMKITRHVSEESEKEKPAVSSN